MYPFEGHVIVIQYVFEHHINGIDYFSHENVRVLSKWEVQYSLATTKKNS